MIRYALTCSQRHSFDSWFQNSAAYDRLVGTGELRCPICGDADVRKVPMAPAIGGKAARKAVGDSRAEPAASEPEATTDTPPQRMEQAASLSTEASRKLAQLRQEIERTHDYVGTQFAEEARKIHDGEIEHRGIYGEATKQEARELAEDGVEVTPLPFTIRLDA